MEHANQKPSTRLDAFDTEVYARTSNNNMPCVGKVVELTEAEKAELETALRLS